MNTELFVMGNPSQIQILMRNPLNARFSLIERMHGDAQSLTPGPKNALIRTSSSRPPPPQNRLSQGGGSDGEEDANLFATDIAARVDEIVRQGFIYHVSLLLPEPLLGHVLKQLSDVTQRALSGVANVDISDGDLLPLDMPPDAAPSSRLCFSIPSDTVNQVTCESAALTK